MPSIFTNAHQLNERSQYPYNMTSPYRIVWHSMDPRSPGAPIGPGEKTDFISIQALLSRPPGETPRPSHILYFHYSSWDAEFNCTYNEDTQWIEGIRIRRMNENLRAWIARPAEFEYGLYERLSSSQSRDPFLINMYMQRGPVDVRMMRERDDEGNRFIEVNVMCRSTGNGPWVIRLAGKLWNANMTEEEELLTNNERRRLGITDIDWTLWAGQDLDDDMDDAGANQT